MRVPALIISLLAIALFVAGCGGPDDPSARLAEACERQIAEIENAPEESDTPVAPSTQEKLDSTTLVECAGQRVVIASPDGEGSDTAAEEGDAVSDESDTAKGEEAEEAASEGAGTAEEEAAADEEAAGEPVELDPAARALFASTCGSCHTLSDADTSGAVGPNLDETTLDAAGVLGMIENGGAGMPGGLLSGDDAQAVADYVAGAAGN
jgi:mono/diheme cytochrome c family protein